MGRRGLGSGPPGVRRTDLATVREQVRKDRQRQNAGAYNDIARRYARIVGGQVMRCRPSGESPDRHSSGKIIFDDREKAEAAAREMQALGADIMRAYECPRSHHGHYHVTRQTKPKHS